MLPPAPSGPSQGAVPAQNLFDWSDMTRSPRPSTTLPQSSNMPPPATQNVDPAVNNYPVPNSNAPAAGTPLNLQPAQPAQPGLPPGAQP
jgi:general secretion pathway protein D